MMELALFCIATFSVVLCGFYIGLLGKGIDRKIAAQFQSRIGPPLSQGFLDLGKLMLKQTIIPENAIGWIFRGAPLVSLVSSVLLLVYVLVPYLFFLSGYDSPLFSDMGDLILIIYLLMIPAVALVAGGFSAGSPLSTIGSQREMVILMATELPLAVVVVSVAVKMNAIALDLPAFSIFTAASQSIWSGVGPVGILGILLLASAFFFVIPAETGKIPFDQAEAETEIAEGLLAEYSGKYLAFFLLSESFKSLGVTALGVILFFPHKLSAFIGPMTMGGIDISLPFEIVFFLMKLSFLYTISITIIRISMARLKITQVVRFMLYAVTPISITGLILVMLDPVLRAM